MSGGVAIYTTWLYSHGLYSPSSKGIVQDPTTGEIRQQKPGVPGKPDIIVPADLNPSPKGFAIVAWDQEGWDSNPPVEIRLYWLNKSGEIFERSYSYRNGGEWKDGPPINFKAAPYSAIAANVTIPVPSEDPSKRAIKIYVQEEGTNHIRELVRESGASQFTPQPVNTSRLPGIPGTKIAADAFQAGATETYYQVSEPTLRWYLYIDGVGENDTFKPHEEFPYTPGAPITVTGSVSGSATVVSVNANNTLVLTQYNRDTKTWDPSIELLDVVRDRQVGVSSHPAGGKGYNRAIGASRDADNVEDITWIGFTDNAPGNWTILNA